MKRRRQACAAAASECVDPIEEEAVVLETIETITNLLDSFFSFLAWPDVAAFRTVSRAIDEAMRNTIQLRRDDLSGGLAAAKVLCVNSVDNEAFPRFDYSPNLTASRISSLWKHINRRCYPGCNCSGDCGVDCDCCLRGGGDSRVPLFGCNSNCSCRLSCPRRDVQLNRVAAVSVFKTSTRGWGLKATKTIAEGTFVIRYVGELLDSATALHRRTKYDRDGLNFLMTVRETIPLRSMVLVIHIDATAIGNESRFLNHSCDPCLEMHLVRVDSLLPHVCFYACREISAGEELTFDYGAIDVSSSSNSELPSRRQGKRPCLCGAPKCTGFLPYDPQHG